MHYIHSTELREAQSVLLAPTVRIFQEVQACIQSPIQLYVKPIPKAGGYNSIQTQTHQPLAPHQKHPIRADNLLRGPQL